MPDTNDTQEKVATTNAASSRTSAATEAARPARTTITVSVTLSMETEAVLKAAARYKTFMEQLETPLNVSDLIKVTIESAFKVEDLPQYLPPGYNAPRTEKK